MQLRSFHPLNATNVHFSTFSLLACGRETITTWKPVAFPPGLSECHEYKIHDGIH